MVKEPQKTRRNQVYLRRRNRRHVIQCQSWEWRPLCEAGGIPIKLSIEKALRRRWCSWLVTGMSWSLWGRGEGGTDWIETTRRCRRGWGRGARRFRTGRIGRWSPGNRSKPSFRRIRWGCLRRQRRLGLFWWLGKAPYGLHLSGGIRGYVFLARWCG